MLTKLSLKNIKSFNSEANLKIAPITLIYGANSSGKSSLWKFLTTLRSSLIRGSGNNFINFDRAYDFANSKTISFNPNRESIFSFQFDDLTQSEDFRDHFKTIKKDAEKDVPIFLRSDDKLDKNFTVNSGIKFSFKFLNINEHDEEDRIIIDDKYKSIIKQLSSKDKLSTSESELLKTIQQIQKYNDQLIEKNKELKQLKRDISSQTKDQSIILNELKIFKDEKLFAEYEVVGLELAPSRIRMQGREARSLLTKFQKQSEKEILDAIKKRFPNDFKFEVVVETDKKLQEQYFNTSEQKKIVFDLIGPNGPKEIKQNIDSPLKYLFIPKNISSDKFFWEEHYNFLQLIKKLIKKNKSNKNKEEPEIYKKYFEQEWFDMQSNFEVSRGININSIPELLKSFNKTLEVMTASFERFCEIMREDLRTCILAGNSFIPRGKWYGGNIYSSIFRNLVDGFVDIAMENDIDGIAEKFNISEDEAIEFLRSYAQFSKYSFSSQYSNLFQFYEELRNYVEHSDVDRRVGMGLGSRFNPRLITSTLHNTPEHKEKIIRLLEKINLPFNIETQSDRDGEVRVGFTNKRIINSQKDIPIEQSGNALKSIIVLLNELALSENKTLIIEEPENKIHPNIQGNLIELITEIIKDNSNNIIIETHSEHFILRIQKLIREKKVDPNFVSINYVYLDENGEGSKIDHMEIDHDGKFKKKWRHGFFNERLKEI